MVSIGLVTRRRLLACCGTLLTAAPVVAAVAEATEDVEETITVVASLTERSLQDVAATVSVISDEEMERQVMRDIRDIVRYEPGVSVGGTGSRFGLDGFNIRGMDGNRVLTLVDGVRVADEFSFGPFLSSRRDFVDIDALERLEIARGPISTLYGSDALGGVVAFTTRTPDSYVSEGRPFYGSARAGYSSDDASLSGTATLALGDDTAAGMLTYTRRAGEEVGNGGRVGGTGPAREKPDPQDVDTRNVDFKLAFTPGENQRLLLSLEDYDNDTGSDLLSDYGEPPTLSRRADDGRERRRYSLNYTYDGGLGIADRLNLLAYRQTSDSYQVMNELRTENTDLARRVRESRFEQEIDGAKLVLRKIVDSRWGVHTISYGGEYYTTESEDLRNGGTVLVDTGEAIPEALPTRDFPPTTVDQAAVFLQDEMSFLDDRLLIMPGVRYDDFQAEARADALYLEGNPGTPLPEDYGDSELTLKLGSVYKFGNGASVFARYAEGFRAPPYDDVNVGFTNFLGGYKTISNPDLDSETSTGIELGARIAGEAGTLRLAVFRNDYDNFIESFAIAPQFSDTFGIDPADGLITFQSVNLGEVRIEGAEMRGDLRLDALLPGLEGFSMRTSVAYAEGEDELGAPIDSVEPLTGILGLAYQPPGGRWGAELVWTLVAEKKAEHISGSRPASSGYGTLDLLAHASVTDRVRLNIGLFNLGDKTYIRWADTASIGTDAPARFTQPGFHGGVNVRVEL